MAAHSSILAWRIPWKEESGGYSPWGHKESDTNEQLSMHEHALTAWNPHLAVSLPPSPADEVEHLLSPCYR